MGLMAFVDARVARVRRCGHDSKRKTAHLLRLWSSWAAGKNRPACRGGRRLPHGWTKHQPGLTPKEHREMLDLERRNAYEASESRKNWCWRIMELIVLVAAAGIFTVIGANIERSGEPLIIHNYPAIVVTATTSPTVIPTPDTPPVQPSEVPEGPR